MEHEFPLKPSKFGMWSRRLVLPLILLAFFSPILSTGLFWDDAVLAVITYRQPDSYEVISASIGWWINGWLETGRFAAVSTILSMTMFHLFDFNNFIGYHVLQILIIGFSCYWFANWFVPGGSNKIAAVLLVCMMSVNYKSYHDPYLSYHLLMPVFTLLFLGSVALFERHLETGVARYGLAALGLYILALATYEIAYPLILVFFVQLLRVRPKCLRTWLFLAVLAVVMVCFQGWLRMQTKEIAYGGISMSFSPWSVMRTIVIQLFSSVPFAQPVGGIFQRITQSYGGGSLEVALVLGGGRWAGGAFGVSPAQIFKQPLAGECIAVDRADCLGGPGIGNCNFVQVSGRTEVGDRLFAAIPSEFRFSAGDIRIGGQVSDFARGFGRPGFDDVAGVRAQRPDDSRSESRIRGGEVVVQRDRGPGVSNGYGMRPPVCHQ